MCHRKRGACTVTALMSTWIAAGVGLAGIDIHFLFRECTFMNWLWYAFSEDLLKIGVDT